MSQSDEQKTIHYKVNDDPQETTKTTLTPVEIMTDAKVDPAQNYLVQIKGQERISYQGKPDEPIEMHDGMKFVTVYTGPVPVSFSPHQGREEFDRQLREQGYAPESKENRSIIDYLIPGGRFTGQTIKLGFEVPQDFPRNPPSGPHISPRLLPINNSPNSSHPDRAAESPFGAEWQYLSRPFPSWKEKLGAMGYLAYVDHLFETT